MKKSLMLLCILVLMVGVVVPACAKTENRLLVTHLVWYDGTDKGSGSAIAAINKSVREDIAYYKAHGIPVIAVDKIYTDAIEVCIYQVGAFDKHPPPLKAHPLPRKQ